MTSKTIAVVGATGQQGGAVASHFHALGWRVRGLTRNPTSDKASALAARLPGIELVQADLDEKTSLRAAFRGAHVIFAVTDFFESFLAHVAELSKQGDRAAGDFAADIEMRRGKNMADVAAELLAEDGVLERYIWSTLPPVSELSGGKYTYAFNYDSKAKVHDYIVSDLPQLAAKTSFLTVAIYTNMPLAMIMMGGAQFDAKGNLITIAPVSANALQYFAYVAETGKFVEALVNAPAGKNLFGYNGRKSFDDVASIVSGFTGVPSTVMPMTVEQMAASIPGVGKIFGTVGAFWAEFGQETGSRLLSPQEVDPNIKLSTIEEALETEDWASLTALIKQA